MFSVFMTIPDFITFLGLIGPGTHSTDAISLQYVSNIVLIANIDLDVIVYIYKKYKFNSFFIDLYFFID